MWHSQHLPRSVIPSRRARAMLMWRPLWWTACAPLFALLGSQRALAHVCRLFSLKTSRSAFAVCFSSFLRIADYISILHADVSPLIVSKERKSSRRCPACRAAQIYYPCRPNALGCIFCFIFFIFCCALKQILTPPAHQRRRVVLQSDCRDNKRGLKCNVRCSDSVMDSSSSGWQAGIWISAP